MVLFQLRNVGIFFVVLSPIFLFIFSNNTYMDSLPNVTTPFTHFNGLDPSRQQYISWETGSASNATLYLGTAPDNIPFYWTNGSMVTIHRMKIDGLQPDTQYYYQVKSTSANGTYTSPVGTFKTAPVAAVPFTAAFFSDTQLLWGIGHYGQIANDIGGIKGLSFVSDIGDLSEWSNSQPDWNLFMKDSSAWMGKDSFAPVMGNHDSQFNSTSQGYDDLANFEYLKYLGFSYSTGQWANHFFYSFNWSNVQFVVGEIADGSQENLALMHQSMWLNQTFAKGQDKAFRVLLFHRCPFSSTGNDPYLYNQIAPIVNTYNVSLVMFGHDHHYERFLYENHTYLCLGGGGGMQDTAFNVVNESQYLNLGPSYTIIAFKVDHMVVKTYSEQNALIEAFTLVEQGHNVVLQEGGDA